MMAKMFYKLAEAEEALGMSGEEIKQLVREGKLREFRDGAELMFKADQIESIRDGGLGGDDVDLGPSDTGGPIGMADSGPGASGSMISLADTSAGRSVGGQSAVLSKDDTAVAIDAGGSGVGMSSPGGGMSSGFSGSSGSGSGVTLLGPDEADADPGDQTAIHSSASDQIDLEAVGSGSGLLDLTRESDDTSLGAELLDEISPGGSDAPGGTFAGSLPGASAGSFAGGSAGGTAAIGATGMAPALGGSAVDRTTRVVGSTTPVVEAADPLAPAFGGAALAAALMSLLGILALACGVVGVPIRRTALEALANQSFWIIAGAGAVLAVVFFVIGLVLGKSRA